MGLEKNEFIEQFKKRTKKFALDSIKLFQSLPKTEEARVVGRQFLRSATSTAANYRAVCRARSQAEFFAKFCITVEEADESSLWLELLIESEIMNTKLTQSLLKELNEITFVLAKARKTTSDN